jgi:hypothetical protein
MPRSGTAASSSCSCWRPSAGTAPRRTGSVTWSRSLVALVLGLESFAFGYGPGGDLMAAWWNEKIMALLMLAACAVGLVQERGGGDRG